MTKALRISLIAAAAVVLVAGVAVFLLSRVDLQSRFETVASAATGLEVAAKGGVTVGFFPSPHVTLKDVIAKNQKSQIASVGQADIGVAFWPLLLKRVRIERLTFRNVILEIERSPTGHFNFGKADRVKRPIPAMNLGRVSFVKTAIRYTNRKNEKAIKMTDCDFESDDVQLSEGNASDIMKHLSLSARVACAEMRNNQFVGTDVRFAATGGRGNFKLTPLTLRILGGKGSGNVDADFTGAIPKYQVHLAVTQLHVDNLFKTLAPGKVGEGFMDFTTDLSMSGFNAVETTRTAHGEASLRGKDLHLAIGDLDKKLERYESSQHFNLVDVGAFFIAGPFGMVVTKGYNFASVFQPTEGDTEVRVLVSHWKVEQGVAHAQDVAMATKENRLAMKGALDFVNKEFDDVTVAVLDSKGCARVEQTISGSFHKPVIKQPNVLASLAGPVSNLFEKTGKMLGAECDVFYEGSVPP